MKKDALGKHESFHKLIEAFCAYEIQYHGLDVLTQKTLSQWHCHMFDSRKADTLRCKAAITLLMGRC